MRPRARAIQRAPLHMHMHTDGMANPRPVNTRDDDDINSAHRHASRHALLEEAGGKQGRQLAAPHCVDRTHSLMANALYRVRTLAPTDVAVILVGQ